LNRRVPVGVPAFSYPGDWRHLTRRLFPYGLKTSRDLHSVVVRDPGRLQSLQFRTPKMR
jgi:hypothetical protein